MAVGNLTHTMCLYCVLCCVWQLEAVVRGVATVVPLALLQLVSWSALEEKTCGVKEIDVAVLRKHTEYEGYSETDDTIVRRCTTHTHR